MDIRKIPEGLNVNGNIFIKNLNIRKIKNITCNRLTVEKNENLLTIENCNITELQIINNKNLVNIENNKIKNELRIFNCDSIKSLDNLNLNKLYIKLENQNDNFVFGKNLKAKDLFLSNFKLKSIPFALKSSSDALSGSGLRTWSTRLGSMIASAHAWRNNLSCAPGAGQTSSVTSAAASAESQSL
jgi:hypothetical protein